MSKKLSKNQNNYLFSILVGVFFGSLTFFILFASFNSFRVNTEISFGVNPIDFISLLINTILVMYVLRTLSRKDDNDKVERELLIGYFTKFEDDFSSGIHRMTSSCGIEGEEVSAFFKKHSMYLQELIDLSEDHRPENAPNLGSLQSSFSEILDLLSNTPREGEIEDGVRIENGYIFYSPRHLAEITKSMGKFKKAVFNVSVCINRS